MDKKNTLKQCLKILIIYHKHYFSVSLKVRNYFKVLIMLQHESAFLELQDNA